MFIEIPAWRIQTILLLTILDLVVLQAFERGEYERLIDANYYQLEIKKELK